VKAGLAVLATVLILIAAVGCGCSACTAEEANSRCADHGGVREWNSYSGTVVCRDGQAF